MKYLKKIFESDENPLYVKSKLIDSIDEYSRLLQNDNIWENFFSNKKDMKSRSVEELTEILLFAENRWEEIKNELEENIQEVKDIYLTYLEDCNSISDYSIRRLSESFYNEKTHSSMYLHIIELKLKFSQKTIEDRKRSGSSIRAEHSPFAPVLKITSDEVFDYWKNIYDFFSVLKSNGYEPSIKYYQVNGTEMIIYISKKL